MSITSFRFVVFTLAVVALYNSIPARHRTTLLLGASVIFYATSSSVLHLLALGFVTVATCVAVTIIVSQRNRAVLAVSIATVVLPLLVLKYYGFVMSFVAPSFVFGEAFLSDYALPLGISFFTFQAIAYITDVYRGETRVQSRPHVIALYLAFFPKLLAGPIERAHDLIPQLQRLAPSTATNLYVGLKLTLWGAFCKLVVSDNIARLVDALLKTPQSESGATLSVAFVLYAFQIYFDFLGYTNIAIGVARFFNICLSLNFNAPYAAVSLRDFWRRWHISLSTWFRDYLYVPLGGNRTSGVTRFGQLIVVFLVSGLWHGAAMHFAAWGAFHGIAFWCEDQLRSLIAPLSFLSSGPLRFVRNISQRMLTFAIVTLGWVFFRFSDFRDIGLTVKRMTLLDSDMPYLTLNTLLTRADSRWFMLSLAIAVVLDSSSGFRASLHEVPGASRRVVAELAYVNWMCVSLLLLGDLGTRDFTYFGF